MNLPKKVKQIARKSVLSYRAKEGNIKVVEDFSFAAPKTKDMVAILKSLGLDDKKVLFLVPGNDSSVVKSGRNLQKLNIMEAAKASTYELLDNQLILMQKSSIELLVKSLSRE